MLLWMIIYIIYIPYCFGWSFDIIWTKLEVFEEMVTIPKSPVTSRFTTSHDKSRIWSTSWMIWGSLHHAASWFLVGGEWLPSIFYFPRNIGNFSSSQLTNSYLSEGWPNHQPDLFLFPAFRWPHENESFQTGIDFTRHHFFGHRISKAYDWSLPPVILTCGESGDAPWIDPCSAAEF